MDTPAFVPGSEAVNADLPAAGSGRVSRENRISLFLAGTLTVIWMTFIFLVAFAKGLLAIPVASGLTLGLLIAFVAVIVVWLLALLYFILGNRQASPAGASSGRGQ